MTVLTRATATQAGAPRGAPHPDGGRRGHARGRPRLLPGRQRRLADRPRAARLPVGLAR